MKQRFAIAIGLALLLSGCDATTWKVLDILADKAKCAIAHQNLPDDEIVARCAIMPSDVERILEIVGRSRQEAALEAIGAMNRQAEQDARSGVCR